MRTLIAFGLMLIATGCGGSEDPLKAARPKTVSVSGSVTYKGVPVEGAQVNFVPASNEDYAAYALTASDGTFRLTTFENDDGAVPGAYKVTISKRSVETILNPVDPSGPPQGVKEHSFLPAKYGSISTTRLTADVPADGAKDLKFDLVD